MELGTLSARVEQTTHSHFLAEIRFLRKRCCRLARPHRLEHWHGTSSSWTQRYRQSGVKQSPEDYEPCFWTRSVVINLIPRQIASSLLIHFGASSEAIGFWIRSLNNMRRFLQIRQACGTPSLSTTGAPEGDALSVCAMLVIAAAFFHKMSFIQVQPFMYADNWTFMSTSQRALFRATVAT